MITLTVAFGVLALAMIAYGVVMVAGAGDPVSANVGAAIGVVGLAIIGLELVVWGVDWIVRTLP